jgi:hypothetical protein
MDKATENLLGFRYAIPVSFTSLGMLPAAIQTFAPYKTHVIDGITSLTTEIRSTTSLSKTPASQDFVIYGVPFRVGDEYVAKLNAATGTIALQDAVATLGMRYLGSTPQQAWFYASAINGFYTFTMSNPTIGATSMEPVANAFRFRNVESGSWDFVSQEVVFKSLMERDIDMRRHHYKDIVRVKDGFTGMIYPPNQNIVNAVGDFDIYGTANGMALQGRHRGQVNRYVLHEYMFREQIKENSVLYGVPGYDRFTNRVNDGVQVNQSNWLKVKGDTIDDFWSEREYDVEMFDQIEHRVYGYFLEPFKLATSHLGLHEEIDCIFEWEINFALTPLMRWLIKDRYVVINLATETIVPGGAVSSEVTHLYLTADMFSRRRVVGAAGTSNYEIGYYTFRFNGRNGAGNSEKLYIWSDSCMAIRGLKVVLSVVTEQRSLPLNTQADIAERKEL